MDNSNEISIIEPVTCLHSRLTLLSKSQTQQPFIYKVHQHLRNVNAEAYEPQIVAIGPYHRGKDNLQMMEEHKLRYLESLLRRKNQKVDLYISAIGGLEERARSCYSEPISLNAPEFIEMLVLDGCFIVELMRKYIDDESSRKNDPIFEMGWIFNSVQRDLILFENQVPFFVLRKLFDLIESPDQHDMLNTLIICFCHTLYPSYEINESYVVVGEEKNGGEIKHLLNFIHNNWRPCKDVQIKVDDSFCIQSPLCCLKKKPPSISGRDWCPCFKNGVQTKVDDFSCIRSSALCCLKKKPPSTSGRDWCPCFKNDVQIKFEDFSSIRSSTLSSLKKEPPSTSGRDWCPCFKNGIQIKVDGSFCIRSSALCCLKKKSPSTSGRECYFIQSATELKKANVRFSKRDFGGEKRKSEVNLFQIDFKRGVLIMPQLTVDDRTECTFRNLIAYEQYFLYGSDYVTDYSKFMDCLINTPSDVGILSKSKIIDNWMGDNEAVVGIFNKLNDSVICSSQGMYSGVVDRVSKHYKRPWNHAMAVLRRDYFNSPWAYLAFLSAVLLLLLTVTQTVSSLIQL